MHSYYTHLARDTHFEEMKARGEAGHIPLEAIGGRGARARRPASGDDTHEDTIDATQRTNNRKELQSRHEHLVQRIWPRGRSRCALIACARAVA